MDFDTSNTVYFKTPVPFPFAWLTEFQFRSDNLVIIPLLLKHLMPAGESWNITKKLAANPCLVLILHFLWLIEFWTNYSVKHVFKLFTDTCTIQTLPHSLMLRNKVLMMRNKVLRMTNKVLWLPDMFSCLTEHFWARNIDLVLKNECSFSDGYMWGGGDTQPLQDGKKNWTLCTKRWWWCKDFSVISSFLALALQYLYASARDRATWWNFRYLILFKILKMSKTD